MRGHSETAPARGCGNGRGAAEKTEAAAELSLAPDALVAAFVPFIAGCLARRSRGVHPFSGRYMKVRVGASAGCQTARDLPHGG